MEDGKVDCSNNKCITDPSILDKIGVHFNPSASHYGWSAANYSMFWGRTLSDGLMLRTGSNEIKKKVRGREGGLGGGVAQVPDIR